MSHTPLGTEIDRLREINKELLGTCSLMLKFLDSLPETTSPTQQDNRKGMRLFAESAIKRAEED
jgi:hypothetical protein